MAFQGRFVNDQSRWESRNLDLWKTIPYFQTALRSQENTNMSPHPKHLFRADCHRVLVHLTLRGDLNPG